MSVTEKGKIWELRNSLWILWTFVFMLNYVAFFWIGAKAKYKAWTLFGYMYLVLSIGVAVLSAELTQFKDLLLAISTISWPVSIVHAFLIRKAYLIRREFVLENIWMQKENEELRNRIRNQASNQLKINVLPMNEMPAVQQTVNTVPMNATPVYTAPWDAVPVNATPWNATPVNATPWDAVPVNATPVNTSSVYTAPVNVAPVNVAPWNVAPVNTAPVNTVTAAAGKYGAPMLNLNTCTEQELASLPGIGVVRAKKAIMIRYEKGGFASFNDFVQSLNIEPHFAIQIEKLAVTSGTAQTVKAASESATRGRVIDI